MQIVHLYTQPCLRSRITLYWRQARLSSPPCHEVCDFKNVSAFLPRAYGQVSESALPGLPRRVSVSHAGDKHALRPPATAGGSALRVQLLTLHLHAFALTKHPSRPRMDRGGPIRSLERGPSLLLLTKHPFRQRMDRGGPIDSSLLREGGHSLIRLVKAPL